VAEPIRVDIDGLAGLAKTLSGIRQQLENMGRDFGRYDVAIGAPKVKAKLSEVAGNWSIARRGITEELARLASMAETAAATYQATEQAISKAAGGHGGEG